MSEIFKELDKIRNSKVFKDELIQFTDDIINHYLHIDDEKVFMTFLELVLDRCKKAKNKEA